MFDPKSVKVQGPLVPYMDGFWSELMLRGYTTLSGEKLFWVACQMSRWLKQRRRGIRDLTDECVAQFTAHRRRQGRKEFVKPHAVEPIMRYLRKLGAAPPPMAPSETPVDLFIREYTDHLARERGLTAATIRGYGSFARRFITGQPRAHWLKWERIEPADITAFVLREARRSCVGQAKQVVTQLRSLLRYVHSKGLLERDLASCVPAVAGWRLAGLPRGLEQDQVERVLSACDHRSAIGRRDGAIVLLLVRLGLRVGEVAALTLEDLDWRMGEIVLRGKGRRESRLPLPRDVGQALAAYLRHSRPSTSDRRIFFGSHAPTKPLTSAALGLAVRLVLRRAGITGGAHLLRHTAATQMLRHGASLPEIGHVLRHRHLDTTAIYAKVDFAALRTVAQPWPGDAP
jgi:site-specific recombinase XerD